MDKPQAHLQTKWINFRKVEAGIPFWSQQFDDVIKTFQYLLSIKTIMYRICIIFIIGNFFYSDMYLNFSTDGYLILFHTGLFYILKLSVKIAELV